MGAIAASGLSAFCLCLLLTPLVRDRFIRTRILDHPDGQRKLHGVAVPRVGGIAIVLAYASALALIFIVHPSGPILFAQHRALLLSFLPPVVVIFLTGLLDDLITLKPWQKLLGQSLASALAVSLGVRVSLHDGVGWVAISLSFFWLLACTNAFNLIDGMDGLAAGIALFAALSTLLVAVVDGNSGLIIATLPLAACLLAFLRYNFTPASIFLGDCGSLTLGFMLGCFGMLWSHRIPNGLGMIAPLVALALPLADVALTIVRRFLRGVSIFVGDARHIHHIVRQRTAGKRIAIIVLYSVCAVASLFSILLSFATGRYLSIIVALFCIFAVLAVGSLGYVEFVATRKNLLRRLSLSSVRDDIHLLDMTKALETVDSVEDLWQIALASATHLRLLTLRMSLDGHDHFVNLEKSAKPADAAWTLSVPLGGTGKLTATATVHARPSHVTLAIFERLRLAVDQRERVSGWSDLAEPSASLSYSGAA